MRAGATFAEALEAALGAADDTPASHQPDVRFRSSVPPFVFANGPIVASRPPLARLFRTFVQATPAEPVRPVSEAAPRTRAGRAALSTPPSHLGAREQRAFSTLVSLGAELSSAFTGDELQREFRTLARTFHPDRHPHASDAERARLSTTFVSITTAYRTLLRAKSVITT